MDLRDYLRLLRARWLLITVCALLGLGAAFAATAMTTPLYRSSTTVFVSAGDADSSLGSAYTGSLLSQQRVKSYVDVAKSRPVAQAVVDALGLPISAGAVVGKFSVTAPLDTVLLEMSVVDPDPEQAQQIATAWVKEFSAEVQRIEQTGTGGAPLFKVSVVEPASLPSAPFSPRVPVNLALGLLVGLAVGVGSAVLLETLDTRVKTVDDLVGSAGAPLLGALGQDSAMPERPLAVRERPHSPASEAYRAVRTNLQFVDVDRRPRSIVVTSAIPQEGKSTTAANLAIALAEAGTAVALVEGDLRRPSLAEMFGLLREGGLTDVLIGRSTIGEVIQPWGNTGRMWVLTAGSLPPNPSELLGSHHMQKVLRDLEREAVVIIDAPPLLPVTDAAVLAAQAGGAILVGALGRVRREQVEQAVDRLESVGGRILGVVANRASTKGPDSYAYAYRYDEGGRGTGKRSRDRGKHRAPVEMPTPVVPTPAERPTAWTPPPAEDAPPSTVLLPAPGTPAGEGDAQAKTPAPRRNGSRGGVAVRMANGKHDNPALLDLLEPYVPGTPAVAQGQATSD